MSFFKGQRKHDAQWPSWINKQQASDLLALLEAHYKSPRGLDLFQALRKRIDTA